MKRLLTLGLVAFALSAQAQYQVGNSDFESWGSDANEPGSGWYSFPSAGGDAASLGKSRTKGNTTKLTGTNARNGGTSVRLISKWVGLFGIGANANGNLTTGKINMGATSADSESNYNYTARGTNNCCPFTGRPDAIEYWARFSRGESGTYNGRCHVILHGDIDYKDPYETPANESAYKIAEAKVYASPSTEWTKFSGELTYTGVESSTSYMLVNFTTNETPGATAGDQFDIDDIKFIYYSQLNSLTVDGVSVTDFDKDTYDYSIDDYYVEGTTQVAWQDNTFAGVATVSGAYDTNTCKYTITVKGQDISVNSSNYHTYTIQFKVPSVGPEVVSSKTYSEDLYVTVAGQTSDKQVADVLVETLDNGNINFVLKNFVLGEGEDATPVGNIAVNDIEVAADGTFAFNGGIAIAAGDDPSYTEDDWGGPTITAWCGGSVPVNISGQFIGENKVVVYITIDITSVLGPAGDVEVHLGYARATMAVNAEAQYGTFCAPYAVEVPASVQAFTVPSVADNNVLDLTEVVGTIPANTPVVLFAEAGLETVESFGVAEAGTPTVGLLTGVYEDTPAPVGSYVLQNQGGKVGFYHVEGTQPTVGANRCYLTTSSGIKAFFFDEDDATPIKAIDNAQQSAEGAIYNLSGQRMSKMQKGLNIINGKKVLK